MVWIGDCDPLRRRFERQLSQARRFLRATMIENVRDDFERSDRDTSQYCPKWLTMLRHGFNRVDEWRRCNGKAAIVVSRTAFLQELRE